VALNERTGGEKGRSDQIIHPDWRPNNQEEKKLSPVRGKRDAPYKSYFLQGRGRESSWKIKSRKPKARGGTELSNAGRNKGENTECKLGKPLRKIRGL